MHHSRLTSSGIPSESYLNNFDVVAAYLADFGNVKKSETSKQHKVKKMFSLSDTEPVEGQTST